MKKYFLPLLVFVACQGPTIDPPAPVYPIPSERQLAWHELEYYAFVHFNMNTFSDMEWGMGDENPSQFNPTALDTRQWARIVKDAGMKGIIITAKHHDGFCLWPSEYTEHSVKNAPWKDGKGDLIQELREACDEYGLKMGIYYSPWDRNHAAYGTDEYITYMRNQLTELLSNYADIFEVWFDGANGGTGYYGGANENRYVDKLTYYDWPNTYALVRELQPGAVMFSDGGPDVRWVGNEDGFAYETTWSNLMRDSVYAGMPEYPEKFAAGQENGTHWVPAEADVSTRPGWYYHAYEDHKVKTLPQLLDIYYKSIGRNASLLINFPVDTRGLIHEKDEEQILKLAEKLKEDFAVNFALKAKIRASNERGKAFTGKNIIDGNPDTYWATADDMDTGEIHIQLQEKTIINRFMAREYYPLGQRVKGFILEAKVDGAWKLIAEGTTIGARRILRFDPVETDELKFSISDAKASPTMSEIGFYFAPAVMTEPKLIRNKGGEISLIGGDNQVEIYYSLNGEEPSKSSLKFEQPFLIDRPTTLKAISFDPKSEKISETLTVELDIAKANWKVLHSNPKANAVFDENPNTFWQSDNNELIIDLGKTLFLYGFTYLPPQNRFANGIIEAYAFDISEDGKNWREVKRGEFSNIRNSPVEQKVRWSEQTNGRYIRLRALRTADGQKAGFAEIGVLTK